jgi:hypothetical protein
MKKLFIGFLILCQTAFATDPVIKKIVDKVLKQNNLSEEIIQQKGQKLLLGELSGGGGKTNSVNSLRFLIKEDQLIPVHDAKLLLGNQFLLGKSISDIKAVKYENVIYQPSQFVGAIIQLD